MMQFWTEDRIASTYVVKSVTETYKNIPKLFENY